MNWMPEFMRTFDWTMGLLIVVWYVAVSLALHRVTRYWVRWRRMRRVGRSVENRPSVSQRGFGNPRREDPMVAQLGRAVSEDSSPEGLLRFERDWLLPEERVDRWNDRLLDLMRNLAPMFGLAGTVAGVLKAFMTFGTQATATLQEIGTPVGLALRSTWLGVLGACFCITVRALMPLQHLQQREAEELEGAWRALGPLVRRTSAPANVAAANSEMSTIDLGAPQDQPVSRPSEDSESHEQKVRRKAP